jgi:hypothetical protein
VGTDRDSNQDLERFVPLSYSIIYADERYL